VHSSVDFTFDYSASSSFLFNLFDAFEFGTSKKFDDVFSGLFVLGFFSSSSSSGTELEICSVFRLLLVYELIGS